ncbi:Proteasome subunit beta type-3-A [Prototheca wickerhamii]|uniref:Proteasome subunit beta n=1 Tax=Prototheca wickerhamii TaxID=3111 RepID=A0AAD9IM15_PROWI|nr:Proteasome subunit beta type-3-A [Prototheca wickerhamii]
MSIFDAIIAMAGKECVAIASDLRFGVQLQTLATDYKKVYKIHDQLFLGLSGLASDSETLIQRFNFKHRLYKLREERNIRPSSFAQLVSATLYEKRFGPYFCQPVIAGLEPDGTPYLCGMDSIGAIETAKDFMVAGTASDALLGICESLWRPDMGPEELFEVTAEAMLSGQGRDCLAGWGAVVYVITKDEIIGRQLKERTV